MVPQMSESIGEKSFGGSILIDLKQRLTGRSSGAGLSVLFVAVLAAATFFVGAKFVSPTNLRSMAIQIPEFGLLSIAMMITLLKGGLNLSIIATANICTLAVGGILISCGPGLHGVQLYAVVALALSAGLVLAVLIGLLNGILIAYVSLSPIIATLGTMILLKGLALGFSRGGVFSGFPEPIVFIGQGEIGFVPASLIVFGLAVALLAFILNKTAFGASLYMIGSNEPATRYSGVDTRRAVVQCYVLSSIFAFLAGLVMMGRFNSANAAYGESYLLLTILAAVLGGINPFGGFGKVGGLVLSLLILQIISSAFNQLNISPFLTLAIWGGLLIVVSAISANVNPLRR